MDWEDKFTRIVRETERNLAKAKQKLSSKAHNTLSNPCQDALKTQAKNVSDRESSPLKGKIPYDCYASVEFDTSFGNMSASSIQVLHMQEQINSQSRTIEKLKHLVKSLDGERDYYKEQIAILKGEVDLLTSTMKNQPSFVTSEQKMSNMKRDVMQEMEKVKFLVQSFEKDSIRRTPGPSPRFDPEFWNIKENLTTSLEQVRFELNAMKGRIGHMESQLSIDNLNRSKLTNNTDSFQKSLNAYDYIRTKPLYTPTSNVVPSVTESDLHHMRMAISSINSKLDNIERKCQNETSVFDEGNMRPIKSSPKSSPYLSRFTDFLFDMDDDLHSLSDPSDLSHLSDGNDSDDDVDVDLLDFDLGDRKTTSKATATSSLVKDNYTKKGRVEFDLSDLDLSDDEEVEEVDLDLCSLDLDH